jgi:YD repeat-containing protein
MDRRITNYTYDSLNRVIREDSSDGASIDYEYEDLGRVIRKVERCANSADWDTQPIDTAEIMRIARRVSGIEIGGGS